MDLSTRYLHTFCPAVQEAYITSLEYDVDVRATDPDMSVDDWLRLYARDVFGKRHRDLPRCLRLALRPYWSLNGSATVVVVPEVSPAAFAQLLRALDAQDIVSIEGLSILNATREDIAAHGPEFFVVPREGFPEQLARAPQYAADSERLMKAYTSTLYGLVAAYVAKALAMVQTRDQVRKLYRALPQVVQDAVARATAEAAVPASPAGPRVDHAAFSAMLQASSPEHRYKTEPGAFAALVEKHIGEAMIGADIQAWVKRDLTAAGTEAADHDEDTREALFRQRLHRALKPARAGAVADLRAGLNKGRARRRRKLRRRPAQEAVGASIWSDLSRRCPHCDAFACEDGKRLSRLGEVLEFANPSALCPKTMFAQRMRTDEGLRACVGTIQKAAAGAAGDDISAILLCPAGEPFSPASHMFSMKSVRKARGQEGRKGTPLVSANRKSRYTAIGNRIVSRDSAMTCMEYTDPRVPHTLIMLPVV